MGGVAELVGGEVEEEQVLRVAWTRERVARTGFARSILMRELATQVWELRRFFFFKGAL
jgi:hypothetical protein